MAEYTAIYEAGNALCEYLRDVMTPEPVGQREQIALASPYEPAGSLLTVYLYSIEEDPAYQEKGFHPVDGSSAGMDPAVLQAGFLLTAHSNAPQQMKEADRYRIMGAAISAIKDMPVLPEKYLTGSLAESGEKLLISLDRVSHENLVKIWSNSSVPYRLSVVVRMNGITIDSKRTEKLNRVTEVQIGLDQKERKK